jgi:site-specific DNA-methyltransferase (adenine-specific)
MIPKLIIGQAVIYAGNNLEVLPELQSNSVDSIVCDPPYELGFMGKSWDNSGIAYSVELWQQCLRVLKPGGHLLAFGGTRTWHRLAVAIEDAGFEIRDNIAWLYGSGFPKSHNISKAIDKTAGVEFEAKPASGVGFMNNTDDGYNTTLNQLTRTGESTDEAKDWNGWGTALKPAHEPIVVARKPVIGTVAENVLKYGVGGLNIDATRIQGEMQSVPQPTLGVKEGIVYGFGTGEGRNGQMSNNTQGRFPANIILDEHTAELLDQQSGISKSLAHNRPHDTKWGFGVGNDNSKEYNYETGRTGYSDAGGASRFFYVAKASKRDRNEGLDELPEQILTGRDAGQDERQVPYKTRSNPVKNTHPTVKPTALMQYLIRLVTPDNGVVLDPFCGSGSTGKAAILEGKRFIGIELTPEYLPIIEGRLKHAYLTLDDKEADLFG